MKLITETEHLTQQALREYNEDNLSEFNKQRTERHLVKCPVCYSRLEVLKEDLTPTSSNKDSDDKAA